MSMSSKALATSRKALLAANDGGARIPEFFSGFDRGRPGADETSEVVVRMVSERHEFELVEIRRR
jgi:hypothetical protein